MPTSVSGLFSLLMMTAAPETFSKRQSLTHNWSEYCGSMSMAVGTSRKRIANQGQPRLVLANRSLALALEHGIDQRELPSRARSSR